MAWHRQLSGSASSSALLGKDLSCTPSHHSSCTPSQHSSSATDSRGSTSERVATPVERQETLESELDQGFDPCPSSWYRQAKQTGGLGGAWRLAFMCLCLPLCYPCYITRKYRRRRRATANLGGISPSRVPLSPSISQIDASPAKDAKEALRVDAMFLQSDSGYKLLNRLPLKRVSVLEGQKNTAGEVEVAAADFTAKVLVAFETLSSDTSSLPCSALLTNLHIPVLVYRDTEELEGVIGRARGILGYCQQYWGGYYPLLLIRMAEGTTPPIKKDLVDKLEAIFSSCLHTSMPENFTKKEEASLMDSLFRLYLHMYKLRCADGGGPHEKLGLKSTSWRCPGQCGLAVQPQGLGHARGGRSGAARRVARRLLHRQSQNEVQA